MKGKGALLIGAAILVATPAWAAWTAFGEDESKAIWYVDTADEAEAPASSASR